MKSTLLKKYGIDAILQQAVKDLKTLDEKARLLTVQQLAAPLALVKRYRSLITLRVPTELYDTVPRVPHAI